MEKTTANCPDENSPDKSSAVIGKKSSNLEKNVCTKGTFISIDAPNKESIAAADFCTVDKCTETPQPNQNISIEVKEPCTFLNDTTSPNTMDSVNDVIPSKDQTKIEFSEDILIKLMSKLSVRQDLQEEKSGATYANPPIGLDENDKKENVPNLLDLPTTFTGSEETATQDVSSIERKSLTESTTEQNHKHSYDVERGQKKYIPFNSGFTRTRRYVHTYFDSNGNKVESGSMRIGATYANPPIGLDENDKEEKVPNLLELPTIFPDSGETATQNVSSIEQKSLTEPITEQNHKHSYDVERGQKKYIPFNSGFTRTRGYVHTYFDSNGNKVESSPMSDQPIGGPLPKA